MAKQLAPRAEISPREHHEWALRLWKRLDRDQSGTLEKGELACGDFAAALRTILAPDRVEGTGGAGYQRAAMNIHAAIDLCLRKADVDGDNTVGFEEFKSFMLVLRKQHLREHGAYLAFALFDLNGSRSIDKEEFKEIMRFFLGHNPQVTEIDEEWDRMILWGEESKHGNDEATRTQFLHWIQTTPNAVFHQHGPGAANAAAEAGQRKSLSKEDLLAGVAQRSGTNRMRSSNSGGPASRGGRSTGSSWNDRPKWNQRFNASVNPGHVNDVLAIGNRHYFSRPQSLPELKRFYQQHTGFEKHRNMLGVPPPEIKGPALIPKILSQERSANRAMLVPPRHEPGGRMTHHHTGNLTYWEDFWPTPLRFVSRDKPDLRPLALHSLFSQEKRAAPEKRMPLPEPSTKVLPRRQTTLEAQHW